MGSSTDYLRLCLLIVTVLFLGSAAMGQKPGNHETVVLSDSQNELHEAWLETGNLQLERPIPDIEPEDPPREPRNSLGFLRWLAELLTGLGPLIRVIFYVGLAIVAAYILYFLLTQFTDIRINRSSRKKATAQDDVLTSARPDQKAARSLLEEADALARQGQFSEAVHLLLFRSIQDIQSRRGDDLPVALTSREIGELQDLPERPRLALRPIVRLVERSFFGGRDLQETDWKTARASYEDFAFGEAWT